MASNKAGDIGCAKEEVPKKTTVIDEFDDDVSDPDEDDLDDLDDMLDEFAAVDLQAKKPSGPAGPAPAGAGDDATGEDDVLSEEEFAKQLQAGMADLLGDMDNSVCDNNRESIFATTANS